ncbi:hypothetical protein PMZ80_000102 [Knufia obscura]|uniref:Uncharacterized protein n=2 Tax=Knufia TaxID=430999 RepID=A0AAN8EIZ6_9EURO|nr:hypothetical protein PMZ80_000102 [Knufia obscura]KAK5956969.1 hypothetical protein OHC33_002458 [Knufia fluminis]
MEATLGYIYSANYDPAISRSYCNISNLEFHVDVYKLACMLEIPELPDLAKSSCTAILGDEHFLYIAAIAVLDLVLSMHYDPNHDPWLRSAALKLAARCRACEDFHVLDSLLTVLDHSAWRKAKDHENFLAEMRLVERERLHEVGQLRREVERLNRELSENKNIPRNDRCTCPSRPIQVVSGPNGACQRLDDHTALVSSTSSTESADFETRPAEFLQLALPDTKQETRAMNKADPDKATFYSVAPGASTGTMRLQEVRQHEISGLQIAWR